ncbi:rhomboid family intramembrane serine protease [Arcticibacter tournemirensis]
MLQEENLKVKFRLIFLPFLIISIGFISLYSLFNYLFYQTGLLNWNIDLVTLWLPLFLPWIPILIWLRPRINLLSLKRKKGKDLDTLYYLVAWAAMFTPTIIAQEYIEDTTGTLSALTSVEQIANAPAAKFYTLKEYYIDKKNPGIKHYSELSGKHNEHLNFTIFVACPILKKKTNLPDPLKQLKVGAGVPLVVIDGNIANIDSIASLDPEGVESMVMLKGASALAVYGESARDGAILITMKTGKSSFINRYHSWLCIRYNKQISSRLSDKEKERLYNEFIHDSEREFERSDLTGFHYLKRVPQGSDRRNYLEAVRNSTNENADNPHLLVPVYEPFNARGGNKLAWIFRSFLIVCAVFALMLLFPKLNTVKLRLYNKPMPAKRLTPEKLIAYIRDQSLLYGTWFIVILNVVVFLVMVFKFESFISFQGRDLLNAGANFRPKVEDGEWWRLFTCLFLHGGVMHLLFNMYGLLFAGVFLEPMLGRVRFLLFYLLAGLVSSLSSIWWYEAIVSVGASGAIFGLYGIFLTLLSTNLFPKDFRKAMLLNTGIYVGLNLIMGMAGGIDNAAHIGGLLSGALIGLLLYPGLKRRLQEADEKKLEDSEAVSSTI